MLSKSRMRSLVRDGILFLACVVAPCVVFYRLESDNSWEWIHVLGAALFVLATLMVFSGLRLLVDVQPSTESKPADRDADEMANLPRAPSTRIAASSEIIHIEHKGGCARVVALLRLGEGPHDVHLLELDVTGDDLRPEVIAEAVAGVASGEPPETEPSVDKVGYASGWGLTMPCPPLPQ